MRVPILVHQNDSARSSEVYPESTSASRDEVDLVRRVVLLEEFDAVEDILASC